MKFEAIIHHTEAMSIYIDAEDKKDAYREIHKQLKWGDFKIEDCTEITGWELADLEEIKEVK